MSLLSKFSLPSILLILLILSKISFGNLVNSVIPSNSPAHDSLRSLDPPSGVRLDADVGADVFRRDLLLSVGREPAPGSDAAGADHHGQLDRRGPGSDGDRDRQPDRAGGDFRPGHPGHRVEHAPGHGDR